MKKTIMVLFTFTIVVVTFAVVSNYDKQSFVSNINAELDKQVAAGTITKYSVEHTKNGFMSDEYTINIEPTNDKYAKTAIVKRPLLSSNKVDIGFE